VIVHGLRFDSEHLGAPKAKGERVNAQPGSGDGPEQPRGELRPGTGGLELSRLAIPVGHAAGDLIRHVWIVNWDLPAPVLQPVLEHPGGNVVVESDRAALYCVSQGTSEQKLDGAGWAAAVLLRPAAITVMTGRSMAGPTASGPALPIGEPLPIPGNIDVTQQIRVAMRSPAAAERGEFEEIVSIYLTWCDQWAIDDDGVLINRIVDLVEDDDGPRRVADLAAAMNMSTRALQRLCVHRIGLSPKWLIQRRRLQGAALSLRSGQSSIADVAADLGYADQAHLAREFKSVIGQTPSDYLRSATPSE
jgi:AraC-like DNA-binding protein